MNVLSPVAAPNEISTAAVVEAVARLDGCAVLLDEAGAGTAAVLEQAARELRTRGIRCVSVSGPASGSLAAHGLIAQITRRDQPAAPLDDALSASVTELTVPGQGFRGVALLVDEAHVLQPSAFQFIQLVCRSSWNLRVVLAGQLSLVDALAAEQFADLRQRVVRTVRLPSPPTGEPAPELRPVESSLGAGITLPARRHVGRRVVAGVCLTALVGSAGWTAWLAAPPARMEALSPPSHARVQIEPDTQRSASATPDGPRGIGLAPGATAQPTTGSVMGSAQPVAATASEHWPEPPVAAPAREEAVAASVAGAAGPVQQEGPVPGQADAALPPDPAIPAGVSRTGLAQVEAEPAAPLATDAAPPLRTESPTPADASAAPEWIAVKPPPQPETRDRAGDGRANVQRATAAPPVKRSMKRRCVNIVLQVQAGGSLSEEDRLFLRDGCRSNAAQSP